VQGDVFSQTCPPVFSTEESVLPSGDVMGGRAQEHAQFHLPVGVSALHHVRRIKPIFAIQESARSAVMNFSQLEKNIDNLVASWLPQRSERMARQALDRADFAAMADAGMTLAAVHKDFGGLWDPAIRPQRVIARLLRKLATADPSLALVTAMHPTVLLNWINEGDGGQRPYADQRAFVFDQVRAGAWFGTISSEPGSGGDFLATRAAALPAAEGSGWVMSGDKYMGSGSGVTSFMMTTARREGAELPGIYLLDTRNLPWDGSKGLKLVREWDGAGMAATQSHAFRFDNVPIIPHALGEAAVKRLPQNASIVGYMFTSVFMGILDAASIEASHVLGGRIARLSAFEKTRWTEAQNAIWLANQAFDGMARALEKPDPATDILHGKLAIADLAEKALGCLAHAIGGTSLSRSSPFAQWQQDIRALGHLRPPRPLTYDKLLEAEATSASDSA
jgi:alkylation response protein AidB-like acyl-CoA dehydrogenase